MKRLRVATWNIAGGRKMRSLAQFDYEGTNLDYFAEQLRRLDLDIVCLQESECNKHESVAKALAEKVRMPHVFETAMHPSHVDDSYSLSLAILSKRPLQNQRAVKQPYPSFDLHLPNGRPAKRTVKDVQIAQTQDELYIANTQTQPLEYLGHPYESDLGKRYATDLADLFIQTVRTPLIFAGDFSTPNPTQTFASLCEAHNLTDALPFKPTKPHGSGHLDCIFVSPQFTIKSSDVLQTETDHFLCWAELDYKTRKDSND